MFYLVLRCIWIIKAQCPEGTGVCTIRRNILAEARGDGVTMLAALAEVKDLLQNCSGIGVDGCSKVERGGGEGEGVWWSRMVRNTVCRNSGLAQLHSSATTDVTQVRQTLP